VSDNSYTLSFGSSSQSDVLDINIQNEKATIHGDLRNLLATKDNSYDCIILTQVLQFIDDYEKAISECKRILKPDGVLLATLPSISRIDVAAGVGNDYWRWTPAGAKYVFSKYFREEQLEVRGYGNVLIGTAFWVGMAQKDLRKDELNHWDPNFPVLVTVKAIK
jgi:SAM-dependent methyltransferase